MSKTPEPRFVILQLLERKNPRPVLVGEAAIELGAEWSLTRVEGLFVQLALEGQIRPINVREKRRWSMRSGWLLV